jgi:hypothetical protein
MSGATAQHGAGYRAARAFHSRYADAIRAVGDPAGPGPPCPDCGGRGVTVSPQDRPAVTNRLRRVLLAFQSAQILILTHQRQHKAPSQAEVETLRDSAAEVVTAFQAFSAAGLVTGTDDQRLVAQAQRYLAEGAA